jgi:hypothetical protein
VIGSDVWPSRILHGALPKFRNCRSLAFRFSERTVARYLGRVARRGDPGPKWPGFLQNHREVNAAFDFFAVPTVTFRVLYCFFVGHSQRKILPRNATSECGADHPATAGGTPGTLPLSLRHLRSGPKVLWGGDKFPRSSRFGAETHQRAGALAEWPCGALDRKIAGGRFWTTSSR